MPPRRARCSRASVGPTRLRIEHLDLSDNPITEGASAAFDTRVLGALETVLLAPGCVLRHLDLSATQLCGRDGDAGYVGEGIAMLSNALLPQPRAGRRAAARGQRHARRGGVRARRHAE